MEDVLCSVRQRLQLHPRASLFVDLDDSKVYLQFCSTALEFALFPHACGRPCSTAFNCDAKTTARQWAARQIRERMQDLTRKHVELIGKISVALPKTLQRVSRYRCPSYWILATSGEIFEMWCIVRDRRMDVNNCEFISSREPPSALDGRLQFFGEVRREILAGLVAACRVPNRRRMIRIWDP